MIGFCQSIRRLERSLNKKFKVARSKDPGIDYKDEQLDNEQHQKQR
jgi:hypothetical protein